MRMSAAEGQIPTVVDRQPLPHIEVRVPSLRGQVQGVARKALVVASRWSERVGGVVNGMRQGVRSLDRKSVGHTLRDVGLQSVVDGRSRVVEKLRVQKSVIVDGVEGKYALFGAEVQSVELQ